MTRMGKKINYKEEIREGLNLGGN